MKPSTILKLRIFSRYIKSEWQHVTEDEIAVTLGLASLIVVLAASAGMAYSIAKSYGWF